jgi:ribosomal protein S18 acetylase RimI-like enzyme
MVELCVCQPNDVWLQPLATLYEASFPPSERRNPEKQIAMVGATPDFVCCALIDDGKFVGFFNSWRFDDFIYGEHFAVLPSLRGRGYGTAALALMLQTRLPLVLEVEPPDTALAKRRIAFYERNGLHLSERKYMQPPYETGFEAIPLRLMTSDSDWLSQHFDAVVHEIHRRAYGVTDLNSFL